MNAQLTLEHADTPAVAPADVVAWEVEIHDMVVVVFAATKAKAQMIATKSYWDAYGRQRGVWPRARASRAEQYDKSALRFNDRQRCWSVSCVQEGIGGKQVT